METAGEGLQTERDHRAPGRVRRLHAGAEVAERRLEEDRVGEDQRDEDDDRGGQVGQDLAEHDPQVAHALLAGGVDELALAQGQHLGADRADHVRDVDEADHERRRQSASSSGTGQAHARSARCQA